MGTLTSNYSFLKPTPGGDTGTWGNDFAGGDTPISDPSPGLNGNWEKLDQLHKALADRVQALEDAPQNDIVVAGLLLTTKYYANSAEVAADLGYGTWEAYAAGRALVGVGSNGEGSYAVGQLRGSETHTLTESQIPSHRHYADPAPATTSWVGDHTHNGNWGHGSISVSTSITGSSAVVPTTQEVTRTSTAAGGHNHTLDVGPLWTNYTGGGAAHNNIQPSIGVYVWRRTA